MSWFGKPVSYLCTRIYFSLSSSSYLTSVSDTADQDSLFTLSPTSKLIIKSRPNITNWVPEFRPFQMFKRKSHYRFLCGHNSLVCFGLFESAFVIFCAIDNKCKSLSRNSSLQTRIMRSISFIIYSTSSKKNPFFYQFTIILVFFVC